MFVLLIYKTQYTTSLSLRVALVCWPLTLINVQQTHATQNDREVVQSVFLMHQSSCKLVFALLMKKTQCITALSFWIVLVCWPLTLINGLRKRHSILLLYHFKTQNDREVVESVFFMHQSSRNLVFVLLMNKTQYTTSLSLWVVFIYWPLTHINGQQTNKPQNE